MKNAEHIKDLLDDRLKRLEKKYSQLVTYISWAYVLVGSKLEEKRKTLFWSPYVAHYIDNMLHDI